MDALQKAFSREERNSDLMIQFGFRLHNQFITNQIYRRAKELEWLESLRQYKGIYDPGVKLDPLASKVYPKITRSKINIVLSRLHEMLFPEIDKNWEIKITPDPRMSKEQVREVALSLVIQDEQTGTMVLPSMEDLNIAIKKFAEDACAKMSIQIDDQFTEMDYPEETKKVLRSGLMFGTGIMKGPLIAKRTKRRWKPVETTDGVDYEEEVNTEDVPDLQFTRIWDWYPDMSTTEIDKIEGSFERHVMTKHDLRQLMKRDDFYAEMIKKFIEEHADGNYVPCSWEQDLAVIEMEAASGKATNTTSQTTSTPIGEGTGSTSNRQLGRKYEVLEYWGYVDGPDLKACGLDIDDVEIEYAANIWLLGDHPIKAVLYPMALDQYKVFYYEKDETSIFGEGLARIMRHSQLAIAAAARMVLDNAACVAGPQVEVNWNLMTADTDLNSIYPRKIWFREGRGVDAQYPALRIYNIDSHVDELLKIVDAFKQFGDEETTLPTWMIGQMVNNETAQATSGRMATITVSIKDVVKNFDTFTEHIIRDMYAWNMDFNPRKDIKGDYLCKARGVSSLVMKEVRMQALNQLTQTLLPEDWDYIPRREFLMEKFKAHDIGITLLTEEEVAKVREARQQSLQSKLAIEMQMAEIAYKKAQTLSQQTKAKKTNIEAIKEAQTPIETQTGEDERITQGELALQGADLEAKNQKMAQADEKHTLDMQHKVEDHAVSRAIDTTKAAHEVVASSRKSELEAEKGKTDIDLKKKAAEHGQKIQESESKHGQKMKETLTKAGAQAKIIAAKKAPAKPAAKPAAKKK